MHISDGLDTSADARGFHPPTLTALATLLMVAWSFVVPVFETPDEPHHWAYAVHLRETGRLPDMSASFTTAYHPPLYYLLIAPLAVRTPLPPPAAYQDADGLQLPFPPRLIHNSDADLSYYWPIRLARLLTISISVLTVWFCYLSGRTATGSHDTGLLSAGLAGFLPGFSFRGMSVSNDALVTCLSALAVWLMLRLLREGFSWRDGCFATFTIAGAYLTKISAICLAVPFVLVLLDGPAPWSVKMRRVFLLGAGLWVIAVPWSLRNMIEYGDPFLQNAMRKSVSVLVDPHPITSPYFREEFPVVLFQSFVGLFGWMNVTSPSWVYSLYVALAFAAAFGWTIRVARLDVPWRIVLLLVSIVLLNLAVVVHVNLTYRQPQGRYMLPALTSLGILTALGLEALLPRRRSRFAGTARMSLVYGTAAVNIYVLTMWIFPAYWPGITTSISHQEAKLDPTPSPGIHLTSEPGAFFVDDGSSQIHLEPSVTADGLAFLEFQLTSADAGQAVMGAVYFVSPSGSVSSDRRIPFSWRPSGEGAPQRIVVPMAQHPEWRGSIERLVIRPSEGQAGVGRLYLRDVRLRNNLGN